MCRPSGKSFREVWSSVSRGPTVLVQQYWLRTYHAQELSWAARDSWSSPTCSGLTVFSQSYKGVHIWESQEPPKIRSQRRNAPHDERLWSGRRNWRLDEVTEGFPEEVMIQLESRRTRSPWLRSQGRAFQQMVKCAPKSWDERNRDPFQAVKEGGWDWKPQSEGEGARWDWGREKDGSKINEEFWVED